jgi:hypothetical protein
MVALAAFVGASCSDSDLPLTAPGTPSATFRVPTFSVTPTEIDATTQVMRTTRSSCPTHAPFNARVLVSVFPHGIPDLRVRQVRIGFRDTSGVSMPQVTLPAPLPVLEFGTDLENRRDRLTFPVNVGLGCHTGVKGILSVWVHTEDDEGNENTGQLQVRVH